MTVTAVVPDADAQATAVGAAAVPVGTALPPLPPMPRNPFAIGAAAREVELGLGDGTGMAEMAEVVMVADLVRRRPSVRSVVDTTARGYALTRARRPQYDAG